MAAPRARANLRARSAPVNRILPKGKPTASAGSDTAAPAIA
jgi:hypothetical protein